jgi:protein-S-isoprenylcysteine O-methyltransferase Ste14
MKKEERVKSNSKENSFGVASVVLGILSILFSSFYGVILGVIGIVFAAKQQKISPNKWSRAGKILSIIGTILSIVVIIFLIVGIKSNPELLNSLR